MTGLPEWADDLLRELAKDPEARKTIQQAVAYTRQTMIIQADAREKAQGWIHLAGMLIHHLQTALDATASEKRE